MAYHCPLESNWRKTMKQLIEAKSPNNSLAFQYLFTLASSQQSVSNFVWNCVRRLVPSNLLGNKNMRILQKKITQFVSFGRFENYTSFGTLMQGFDPNSAPFLAFKCSNKKEVRSQEETKHKPEQGRAKKKNRYQYFMNENSFVFRQFIIWLFEEYIVHVIRTNFYATEKQTDFSKVFYFRKPVWSDIMILAKGILTSEMLREVKAEEVKRRLEVSKFCLGKLRLIPKKSTVRPIMTFNKLVKGKSGVSYKAMNQLKRAHAILKTLKNGLRQEKKGFSVFNYYDVMQSLTPFVQSWREYGRPQLFSVSLDIEKCYDNVIPAELIHFLNKTQLLSQSYTIESYVILKRTRFSLPSARLQKYYRTRNVQIAFDERRFLGRGPYDKLERNGYDVSRSIIVRKSVFFNVQKQWIVDQLQNIINNTVVSFNKNLFHQIKGIPQGLNVSYILNSFYFSELESAASGVNFIKQVPVTVCMRLTDDYLFISSDKEVALKFMKTLFRISAKYEFRFNLSKIRSNFQIQFDSLDLPKVYRKHFNLEEIKKVTLFEEPDWCTWIGLQIQFSSMWVKPKLPPLPDDKLLNAVTVNFRSRKTSAWLAKKVRTMLLNNLAHFLHTSINSIEMIQELALEMGQVVAFKMLPCFYDFTKHYQILSGSRSIAEKKMARILKKVFGGMKEYLKNIKWKADKEKKNFEGKNIDIEAPSLIARASLTGFLGLIKKHFYRNYPTLYRVLSKESQGYI